ncbi:MAG TPA: phosphatase PAP2 family protein [Azospirillaceae bacterium]|nr:phosphatase PAP2 family protein [Azospirillaceae bacterium]
MEDRTLPITDRPRSGRTSWRRAAVAGGALALVSLLFLLKPGIDLLVSGYFWTAELGFAWRSDPVAEFFHDLVQVGARVMAVVFILAALWTAFRRTALWGWGARVWSFLLLALLVGPGLITNTVLKDNWGRARPWQVEEFGGKNDFSPALLIADACERNCSFVSGDAALAFYLHSFAYVMAARRSRRVLALGLAAGAAAGLLRIGMGAHFLSDVIFAAVTVMATSALLHALMFGRARTGALWSHWTSRSPHPGDAAGGA